jgi:hypothetical protein
MQPITIEPLSYIAFIIIIITFFYSFFKYRKEYLKKEEPVPLPRIEGNVYERPALVAAIAMMMEEKPFRIKRVVLSGQQEKSSSWRQFGRQEIMRRRMNLQK